MDVNQILGFEEYNYDKKKYIIYDNFNNYISTTIKWVWKQ